MKRYRVDGGPATFGPGQVMLLEPKQIESRRHILDVPKDYDGKKPAEVTALAVLQFKVGEVIGLPVLEKRLADVLAPLEKVETPIEEIAIAKRDERREAKKSSKKDAEKAKAKAK